MTDSKSLKSITKINVLFYVFEQPCHCHLLKETDVYGRKCFRCIVLDDLRECWPDNYSSVADNLARHGVTR